MSTKVDLKELQKIYVNEVGSETPWSINVIKQILRDCGFIDVEKEKNLILALARVTPQICHFCRRSFRPCRCEDDE